MGIQYRPDVTAIPVNAAIGNGSIHHGEQVAHGGRLAALQCLLCLLISPMVELLLERPVRRSAGHHLWDGYESHRASNRPTLLILKFQSVCPHRSASSEELCSSSY